MSLVLAALTLGGCGGLPPAFSVVRVLAVEDVGAFMGSAIPLACEALQDGTYRATFLTARHVIQTVDLQISPKVWVGLFEEPNFQFQSQLVPVRLIVIHPTLDLAMFTARLKEPIDCLVLDYRMPVLGEMLTAAGYSNGDSLLIDEGIVSSLAFYWTWPQWEGGYTGNWVMIGGMSGGAMIDSDGYVVAVIVGGDLDTEHGGVILPVLQGRDWIESILELWEMI